MIKTNLPTKGNNNFSLPAVKPEAALGRPYTGPGQPGGWERLIGLTIKSLACLGGAAAVILALALGAAWAAGAFLGAGLVFLNLLVLKKALAGLARQPGARVSLRPYLAGFAGSFGLTALAALAVIWGRLGHPLAFLAGLSLLWPALMISAAAWLIRARLGGRENGRPPA